MSEIWGIKHFDSALTLKSYGSKCPDMTGSGGKSHSSGITRVRNDHLSNAVHESAVSMVAHWNSEFYDLFNREIKKGKSRTEAYVVVGKHLLLHVYGMMKNKRSCRERRPYGGKRERERLPVES